MMKMLFPSLIYVLKNVCTDIDVRSDMLNFVAISGKDVPQSGRDVTCSIQTLFPTSTMLTNDTANCLTGYLMSLTVLQILHAAKIPGRKM